MAEPFDPNLLDAPHRDERGLFFNPWKRLTVNTLDVLRWRLSRRDFRRHRALPAPPTPRVSNDGAHFARREEAPSWSFVGHSTFALHAADSFALTDPHFGPRALLPPRLEAPGLPLSVFQEPAHGAGRSFDAPIAVLSHDHYDHLDTWTIRRLSPQITWFVPLGLGDLVRRAGARVIHELDWWQSAEHGPWRLTCVPAQHWSRRGITPNTSLWCGWLIEAAGVSTYFVGDTGYFGGFPEIGRRLAERSGNGRIDVALMPIGAYEPRWFMGYQHQDPREALQAFEELGARSMLGMHWGVFDLTDEAPNRAIQELGEALAERAARGEPLAGVHVPAIGERWFLPPT